MIMFIEHDPWKRMREWGLMIKIACALLLIASLAGCDRPTAARPADPPEKLARPAVPVELVRPTRRAMRKVVEEPGQVEAYEITAIHAKISGYVRSWDVNIGSKVRPGQILAEIDVPDLEVDVERKRAMLEQAEAKRVQAEAAVAVAQADILAAEAKRVETEAGRRRVEAELARWQAEFSRVEQLFRERAQTGSLVDETRSKLRGSEAMRDEVEAQVRTAQATVAQARAAHDKAKADLAATAAGIALARADVKGALALLSYRHITAPFDGVVTRRNLDTGHLTLPGPGGEPLFVVARTDMVTVVVAVPELFATAVEPGDRVVVTLQAIPGKTFEAPVARTAYALDPKSRTLRVEVDLPNQDGQLHPGLYAYASIVAEEHANALTIPSTAILKDGDAAFCVVARQGVARRTGIKVGWSDASATEVLSGIDDQDQVVKVGAGTLVDGLAVEALKPAKP